MSEPSSPRLIAHRYQIVRALGQGSVGSTFLARDLAAGGDVALKLARSPRRDATRAFQNEFALLRGIIHPNLSRLRDFGYVPGPEPTAFFTADFVAGVELGAFAASATPPQLLQAIRDVLAGLARLHAQGIRHGDVKPANVLITPEGRGVLIDLSCGQRVGEPARALGTRAYAAPEITCGLSVDHRADLFALGTMIDEILPKRTKSAAKLSALVLRLTAEDPTRRPADATEVLEVLGSAVCRHPIRPVREPPLLGRERELARWDGVVERWRAGADGPRAVVVTGIEGVGRSRLLRELKWVAQPCLDVVEVFGALRGGFSAALAPVVAEGARPERAARDLLDELRKKTTGPLLLVVDDADRLPASEWGVLLAWLASIQPSDRVGLAIAAFEAPRGAAEAVLHFPLGPLGPAEVGAWLGAAADANTATEVLTISGGYPRAIARLASLVLSGKASRYELERAGLDGELSPSRASALANLSARALTTLAVIAASRQELPLQALTALEVDPEVPGQLAEDRWIEMGTTGVCLARPGEREAILRGAPSEARAAHRALASWLAASAGTEPRGPLDESALAAQITAHQGDAGAWGAVRSLIESHADLIRIHPDAWVENAHQLSALTAADTGLLMSAAAIFERAGRSRDALRVLARALRRDRSLARRSALWLCAGNAYLRAGQLGHADRSLARALAVAAPEDRAEILDARSRTLIKRSAFAEAERVAADGLALEPNPAIEAALLDDIGLSASYRGLREKAHAALERAARLHLECGHPRGQARSASYRALAEYRAGDTSAAAVGFASALKLAEHCGATDLIVYAAQNLAVSAHQAGDLGQALDSYERAIGMAVALGDRNTEAVVRVNLAKLFGDLGLLDRALLAAEEAEREALKAGLVALAATAAGVAGEIALAQVDGVRARDCFLRALSRIDDRSTREGLEISQHLAEAHAMLGDFDAASSTSSHVEAQITALEAPDLLARLRLGQAIASLAKGEANAAIVALEEARFLARRAGQHGLVTEVVACYSQAYERLGSLELALGYARAARDDWQRTAAALPAHMRAAFLAHHSRRLPAPPSHDGAGSATSPGERELKLGRLLDINKKLSSLLARDTILQWTIDYALELTGAQRGFVILNAPSADAASELTIAVGRNIDAAANAEELAFSQSIARRVVDSGRPVVTVDARSDRRFDAEQSVHAMQLTSVCAVPILAPNGVMGALYLDHRFRLGLFDSGAVQTLEAFADQVAIALRNAALHEELTRRTAELAELARGQAETIEDLSEKILAHRELLHFRYDYGRIIGHGRAMTPVFRLLDRVIPTDVSVLIEGESGTGKELLAKAIHANGPRREAPFVAINCGALPEALLEAELFGHEKGAFTGASHAKEGLFVAARGGTVFLDELGEMPSAMQVKLLRVLQEREVRPVGARRAVAIDARIVCATNKNIHQEVKRGRFREDLYYRVGVVEIKVPPLRERLDDLPALADHLLAAAASRSGRPTPRISPAGMKALLGHPWPGNVRELENVLTKAVLLSDGPVLGRAAFELIAANPVRSRQSFDQQRDARLVAMLHSTGWNLSETARRLRLSRPTLYRHIERLGLSARTDADG